MGKVNRFKKEIRVFMILGCLLCLVAVISGCWVKLTDTPFFTQITDYYCGAASAQMILDTSPLPHVYVASQDTIYNYIHPHNHCPGWYTDPDGECAVLNHYYPAGGFFVYAPNNQNDANKKIAYTIDKYDVPPAALVYGSAHWMVVTGVYTDQQPSTHPSYTINGFFVNDPWPHSGLGQNKYLDINTWNTGYFTGAQWCGATGTVYISVDDPHPVPAMTVTYPKVLPRRAAIISIPEIQAMAQQSFNSFKQQKDVATKLKVSSDIINNSKLGTPVLVTRSDRTNDAYYIVPFQLQTETATSGAMIVDAYSGQMMEVTFVPKAVDYTPILKEDTATKLFQTKIPSLKLSAEALKTINLTFQGKLQLKPAEVHITKIARVWEPSVETLNPYYPLWRVEGTIQTAKTASVLGYMDATGKTVTAVTKLSTSLKGGGAQ